MHFFNNLLETRVNTEFFVKVYIFFYVKNGHQKDDRMNFLFFHVFFTVVKKITVSCKKITVVVKKVTASCQKGNRGNSRFDRIK